MSRWPDFRPPEVAWTLLLPALRDVGQVAQWTLAEWDRALPVARQARMLGQFAERIAARPGVWEGVPDAVRGHLQAACNVADYRARCMHHELGRLRRSIPANVDMLLLKGAAYLVDDEPCARGRLPADMDLLVPRSQLALTEASLRAAGWRSTVSDAYDDRYYREWSHELPPMRHPDFSFELDVHHTISPVTARVRADATALFERAVIAQDTHYRVLSPADRVVHAAIHLFQDTELDDRLRDLLDIDGLLRRHGADRGFWGELLASSQRHCADRPLGLALHYARGWLDTPMPRLLEQTALTVPDGWRMALLDWVMRRSFVSRLPEVEDNAGVRLALRLGSLRYHRLRMRPTLLLRHTLHKFGRRLGGRGGR